jgi:hypothetical protein
MATNILFDANLKRTSIAVGKTRRFYATSCGTLLNCSGVVANPADQQGTLVHLELY